MPSGTGPRAEAIFGYRRVGFPSVYLTVAIIAHALVVALRPPRMLEVEIPAKDGRYFSIQQRHKGDIGRLAKNVSLRLIRSKNSSLTYVSLNGYPPDIEVFDAEILSRGLKALCVIIAKHGV